MPSSVSTSISSSGALVIRPRLVPSAKVIGTSTPTAEMARTVRAGKSVCWRHCEPPGADLSKPARLQTGVQARPAASHS